MLVHSSASTRLDLAGGTLDIWPLYLFHNKSQTINAALSLKAECTVSTSKDQSWHLESQDTNETIDIPDLDDSQDAARNKLVNRVLQHFRPDPVKITTRSDSPVGAGLAGQIDRHAPPTRIRRFSKCDTNIACKLPPDAGVFHALLPIP